MSCLPPLMENGPHEEAAFPEEEPADDELPLAHSPVEELEEVEVDEEESRPQKRPRHEMVDSVSTSSPPRRAAAEEDDDTGSSSLSAKDPKRAQEPMTVNPLASAPPIEFGRMASVSLDSDEDDDMR